MVEITFRNIILEYKAGAGVEVEVRKERKNTINRNNAEEVSTDINHFAVWQGTALGF